MQCSSVLHARQLWRYRHAAELCGNSDKQNDSFVDIYRHTDRQEQHCIILISSVGGSVKTSKELKWVVHAESYSSATGEPNKPKINVLLHLCQIKEDSLITHKGRRGVAGFYARHFSVSWHCNGGAYLLSVLPSPAPQKGSYSFTTFTFS